MGIPWYKDGLRFACTKCGACCTGDGEVVANTQEIIQIAKYLKLPTGQFVKTYLDPFSCYFKWKENHCCFLKDNKCLIYPFRPKQCKTWPWWKEALSSREVWNREAQKCPGMNRGRLYTINEIKENESG